VLWLVKHGVPFATAEALDPIDRRAWGIVMGQFAGGEFDFSRMGWRERR
jgi:hypothetical protein